MTALKGLRTNRLGKGRERRHRAGILDRREQTIARSHGAVPLVHAGGDHVGIRIAVTMHDHDLLPSTVQSARMCLKPS
jgi:hypothetical protein